MGMVAMQFFCSFCLLKIPKTFEKKDENPLAPFSRGKFIWTSGETKAPDNGHGSNATFLLFLFTGNP